MREFIKIKLSNPGEFSIRLLFWCKKYHHISYLNSNTHSDDPTSGSSYDVIAAVDSITSFQADPHGDSFGELKTYCAETKDWLFGHFAFDLKNQTEKLSSDNFDGIKFPELCFFQPRYLFMLKGNELEVGYLKEYSGEDEIKELVVAICQLQTDEYKDELEHIAIKSRITKNEYISKVNSIKQHIHRGDIYEMNFCMEYFSEQAVIDPLETYLLLNEISQTPFSAFYRVNDNYLLSASPERFLKKSGDKLLSQPIKGTIKRGTNSIEDEQLKKQLFENEKERNENVMIVDLVRNDLSRSALRGSVKVEELYGVYTFKQVHQMISSISAELKPGIHFIDAIKNAFPMGSMTGAPKVKAMELIEQYESTKRGLYSGAIGYITPSGDFDLNVVIRSILYNASNKYLSFMAGSAITSRADAEQEYEECLLKAKAFFEVLGYSRAGKNIKLAPNVAGSIQ